MDQPINILGEPLQDCGNDPATGFFRDGCCNTGEQDFGLHTVCVAITDEFLEFSRSRGNDLATPRPGSGFTGLKEGDRWCLCAARWLEAYEAGQAPRVFLTRSHRRSLEIVPMEILQKYAADLN